MDYSLSAQQQELMSAAKVFANAELNHQLYYRDKHSEFNYENWLKCADFGIQGSFIPQTYGGRGQDIITTIAIMEGLGQGCKDNGLTLALNGQMWSIQEPLLNFGTEEQKQRYLPRLCDGTMLGAHGMTEPDTGSDAFNLKTTATKADDGYVLNGDKVYIGLAPQADLALIFANTNPEIGKWGITAFLVEKDTQGFKPTTNQEKMGLRTGPFGGIELRDCFVPEENRLGREGSGVSIFNSTMEWERSFIFAGHVGSMARQLEYCIEFAGKRNQGGSNIGAYQSVSNRLANMKLRLETSRMLLYKLAWLKDQGKATAMDAALAKLHISESFVQSSMDAIRISGAKGYISEFEIERDLRDSLGGVIYSGTSDIQRNIIARGLGI